MKISHFEIIYNMQFTYFLPLWIILFCIVISSSITIYGYVILGQPLQRLIRNVLITLRVLAIAILLCCLLAPVIIEKKDITPPAHLSILVDSSQSMQMKDNYKGKSELTRYDQVQQLLFSEKSELLNELNGQYKVHIYNFDSTLYKDNTTVINSEPKGPLTDISSSIQDVVDIWKGQTHAGIVLISDGAHNASNISSEDVNALQTPIYAIGVGSPERPKDVLIKNIELHPIAYTGHESTIRIHVEQKGYTNESVRVTLSESARNSKSNRLIDAKLLNFGLNFDEDVGEQTTKGNESNLENASQHFVELKLTPDTEGSYQYKVVLSTLEDEFTSDNNEQTFSLKVIKAKLNVFYYEGRPRWEYAFLKRTLERDPDIDATFAVRSINANAESVLSHNSGYFPQEVDVEPNQFPKTLEELSKFDVIILGDLTFGHLNSNQQKAVRDFVEKRGKAAIFLPSHNALGRNGLKNTEFASVLPIQIPSNGCSEQKGEFAIELTQAGIFHPILQLDDKPERNIEIWQNLPPLTNAFAGFQHRAGATTLLKKQNGQPILLFQRVGLGKSLLFTAEGLWNWNFGVGSFKDTTYTTVYQQFWAQIFRWMGQEAEENRIYISTDASTYAQGDEVEVSVRVYSYKFKPQENSEVKINVTSPGGSTYSLRTRGTRAEIAVNQTNNIGQSNNIDKYNATFKAEESGIYKIQASGKTGNVPLGEDEINVSVQQQLVELESPQLNEELLRELTEQTDGVYLNIEDAHLLPDKITNVENQVFVDTKRDLWAHPILLITIVCLLGSEWFIRKRVGLV